MASRITTWQTLRANTVAAVLLILDLAPGWVVRSDLYVVLRRRCSKSPRRFTPPAAREISPDPEEWPGRKLATAETDLVIEGFPGSGNSYVSNCLRAALDRPAHVESHFHYTAQLKRALSLGVPAVVIVRRPLDAWSSLKSKEPELFDALIALRWIHYHAYVLRYLHRLHVFLFDEIVADVDAVRRGCEGVRRLLDRPIAPVSSYRRVSEERRSVDIKGTTRLAHKMAAGIFAKIDSRLRLVRSTKQA